MIEKFLNSIFPSSCAICGKLYSKSICPRCFLSIKKSLDFYELDQNEYKLFFISFYEEKIKQLLLDFKFKEKSYLSEFFTELLLRNEKIKNLIQQYDFITYVPMYNKNKKMRGYNQTELITKELSKRLEIEKIDCIKKIKENKKQSLLSEKERKTNVKDVYKIINKDLLEDKNILLIDDIYTTGSTATECIREILKGKPKKADVLTISKSKKGKEKWKI